MTPAFLLVADTSFCFFWSPPFPMTHCLVAPHMHSLPLLQATCMLQVFDYFNAGITSFSLVDSIICMTNHELNLHHMSHWSLALANSCVAYHLVLVLLTPRPFSYFPLCPLSEINPRYLVFYRMDAARRWHFVFAFAMWDRFGSPVTQSCPLFFLISHVAAYSACCRCRNSTGMRATCRH